MPGMIFFVTEGEIYGILIIQIRMKFYALSGGVVMNTDKNNDDLMNNLLDFLWVSEEDQRMLYLHQNILFGRDAVEEKIACATLPYLFQLGVTPQMRGYEILCRAVILYLLDCPEPCSVNYLFPTIALERGTSLDAVERPCFAAIKYAWDEGYMSADDEDALMFSEMPTPIQLVEDLAKAVQNKLGDEIKL